MKKTLTSLLMLVLCIYAVAQQRVLIGKVTDEMDKPLSEVSVKSKGAANGTLTDITGNFKLSILSTDERIVISSIGYTAQDIAIAGKASIAIKLRSTTEHLDEVVVVAYGTAKKKDFTGSSTQITAKQIENRPLTNVAAAIVGAAPGVITNAGSGQPGNGPEIRIRGFGSINASNAPLYVVDGVPYDAGIGNINTSDVETVSLLKDASSTALYGSRAANGVVMITTKKGKVNKNTINVGVTRGFTARAIPEYDMLDAYQYYPLMWEAYRNSLAYRATNPIPLATANQTASGLVTGQNGIRNLLAYNPFNVANTNIVLPSGELNPAAQLIYKQQDLDWESALTRMGQRGDYNVSIAGGTDKSDYLISMGYLNEKGFAIRSDYERYTGRVNLNIRPTTWFKTGLNIAGSFVNSNQPTSLGTVSTTVNSTSFVNPFYFSRNIGPIYPIYAYDPAKPGEYLYDLNGNKRYDFGNLSALGIPNRVGNAFGGRHVLAEAELNKLLIKRNVWSARTFAEISFTKQLKLTTNLSADITNFKYSSYQNPIIGDGAPAGTLAKEQSSESSFTLNQLLNYNHSFGKHSIDVLAGHESYSNVIDGTNGSRNGQIFPAIYELSNFAILVGTSSFRDQQRLESYLSRVNYQYNSKYYLSASFRRDGSSRFSPTNRWGNFFSMSAAWRIESENFMRSVTWVNNLKLRASYGSAGNNTVLTTVQTQSLLTTAATNAGLYASQQLYGLGFNNAAEPGILRLTTLGNPALTWEQSKQFDIAIEFGFFNNRLSGTFEYFNRMSSNLLFDVPLPVSSGILVQNRNIGSMYNRGLEINLSGDIIKTKNFLWNLNLNWSKINNQITELPQADIISGTKKLNIGRSLYDYWLRDWQGVDPSTGAVWYAAQAGTAVNSFVRKIGDTVTTDVNNARFTYYGSAIPDYFGSITSTFTYRNISFSCLFTFQQGGQIYDATYAPLMSAGSYGRALHVDALRRWQKPGDITDVPRMDAGQTSNFDAASTRWLIDASFFNIRSVTLNYDIPQKTLGSKIKAARFYIAAENLQLFAKRTGMNVEQSFTGVTSNTYVPGRLFSTGIHITL